MLPVFRIDDIGASTKHFNQRGKKWFRKAGIPFFYFPFANLGFFKRIPPFRQWAKYNELTVAEWEPLMEVFRKHQIKPIIAITASWVSEKGELTPFPEKFPEQAQYLKQLAQEGDIILACHGYTHCIVGKHQPRLWGSNRQFHREFWPYLDQEWHTEHITKAMAILEDFFELPIEIFVPPGNVWSTKTYKALKQTSIKKVISYHYMMDSDEPMEGIEFVSDREGYFNFHDRELKLWGVSWLEKKIKQFRELS